MAAKESRPYVVVIFKDENVPTSEEISAATKRSRLKIEYESMYGKQFVYDTN